MIVELISVGTEILLGNIVNTNAAFLSEKCAALGLSVYYQVSVGDNYQRLYNTIKTAFDRSDIVIMTGGLGPTNDDITKRVAADVLGKNMYLDEEIKNDIYSYLKNGPYSFIPESNYSQAYVPEGAIVLKNSNGTAPGLIMEKDDKAIIMLPGPPKELKLMFEKQVEPYLRKKSDCVICSETVKIASVGESQAAEIIKDILDSQTNPTIAPYAKLAEVHLRITAKATDENKAKEMINPVVEELKKRFKEDIFSMDETEELEDAVVKLLMKNNLKLSTAESCTGGKIASRLINVSGVSSVYEKGFVTYSDMAKSDLLGVNPEIISEYGVVSKETAIEMATKTAMLTKTDAAISVTGIAGPDGGTQATPVGTVFVGCYLKGKVTVQEFHFSGNRENVRENAAKRALNILRLRILKEL